MKTTQNMIIRIKKLRMLIENLEYKKIFSFLIVLLCIYTTFFINIKYNK